MAKPQTTPTQAQPASVAPRSLYKVGLHRKGQIVEIGIECLDDYGAIELFDLLTKSIGAGRLQLTLQCEKR